MNMMIQDSIDTMLTKIAEEIFQNNSSETKKAKSLLKAKGYYTENEMIKCIKTTLAELTYYSLHHSKDSVEDIFYYKLMNIPSKKNNFSDIEGKKTYFIFEAWLDGYKDKMYRKFKMPASKSLNELAFAILATFHLDAEHSFEFHYHDETYYPRYDPDILGIPGNHVILKDLELDKDPDIEMVYDLGCCYTINIHFVDMEVLDKRILRSTPVILDGIGNGLVENQKYELIEYLNGHDLEIDQGSLRVKFSYVFPYITYPFDLKKNQYLTQGRYPLYKDIYEHLN